MQENQRMERKASWRDEYIKWICGFANAQGGCLEIGKDDKGRIVGLKDARKLMENIPNKVRDILGMIVDVNLHSESGKEWISIEIEPQLHPVNYKGQYHYRSGSTKQELKGAALDRFLLKKHGKTWDGVPVPHVSVDNLDSQAFELFKQNAVNSKRLDPSVLGEKEEMIISRLRLEENKYLVRAALLLFHPDPEKYFSGAHVKIGYFRTSADLRYQDVIEGNLFYQVDKTMELLTTKYMIAEIGYRGIHRVEEYSYRNRHLNYRIKTWPKCCIIP